MLFPRAEQLEDRHSGSPAGLGDCPTRGQGSLGLDGFQSTRGRRGLPGQQVIVTAVPLPSCGPARCSPLPTSWAAWAAGKRSWRGATSRPPGWCGSSASPTCCAWPAARGSGPAMSTPPTPASGRPGAALSGCCARRLCWPASPCRSSPAPSSTGGGSRAPRGERLPAPLWWRRARSTAWRPAPPPTVQGTQLVCGVRPLHPGGGAPAGPGRGDVAARHRLAHAGHAVLRVPHLHAARLLAGLPAAAGRHAGLPAGGGGDRDAQRPHELRVPHLLPATAGHPGALGQVRRDACERLAGTSTHSCLPLTGKIFSALH